MASKFTFLFLFSCLSLFCNAQQQITDFKNPKITTPGTLTFLTKFNGKVLFSAFTPETGEELWISDGSESNTKLLKDINPGSNGSLLADFAEHNKQLYFRNATTNELWKTDGSPAGTSMVMRSDSLAGVYAVKDKLLLTFKVESNTIRRLPLAWLDEKEQVKFWEMDATALKVADNNLYYATYDSLRQDWQLNLYGETPILIHQKKGPYVLDIALDSFKGYEYFGITETGLSTALLVGNAANRKEQAIYYPWGSVFMPVCLRDSSGALFLIKNQMYAPENRIQVFKVRSGHGWDTVADIPGSKINAGLKPEFTGPQHLNFSVEANALAFISLYGYEGISAVYLNVFDFKANNKRLSDKLPGELSSRFLQIRQKSTDIYQLTGSGKNFTYNLKSNSVVAVEDIVKAPVEVGGKQYEISDNLYLLASGAKTPLVRKQSGFSELSFIHRDTTNNKILFWTYSEELKKNQLWASNGSTTQEILQYNGFPDAYGMRQSTPRVGKSIIFTASYLNGIRVFATDGTAAGTKELLNYPTTETPSIRTKSATNGAVLLEMAYGQKISQIYTNIKKTSVIDLTTTPFYKILATTKDFYVLKNLLRNGMSYDVLEKIDNGVLKLVDLNKNGNAVNHQAYQDKIYFTLRNDSGTVNGIYNVGSDNKIKQIFTGPVETFSIRDKYLVTNAFEGNSQLQTITTVMHATSGQVLHTFKRAFAMSVASHGTLALFSEDQLIMVRDTSKREISLKNAAYSVTPSLKGFVIKSGSEGNYDAHYYYVKTQKLVPILEGKNIVNWNENPLSENLIFITNSSSRENYIWIASREKLIPIPPQENISGELNANLFSGNHNDDYSKVWIYSIENDQLKSKYHIEANTYFNLQMAGNSNYASGYEAATGNEVTRLEKDSVYHFEQIVKGPAGVLLRQVFHFNESIYAVGFAHSKGLQVWKMGVVQEEQKEDEETETPEVPQGPGHVISLPEGEEINIYPNPVFAELNIDLNSRGTVKIIDLKGLEIFHKDAGGKTLVDLKDIAAGTYLIIFKSRGRTIVKKVIKL
jgi:ELWxxDGT repeat protein